MEFRALGPLEVDAGGRMLRLGGLKQRAVLARLLLEANRVVSVDSLIGQVWGQDPPPRARATLQVYVTHVRKILAIDHEPRTPARLERRPPGYVVHLDDDELDVIRFRRLAEGGRTALQRGDAREARRMLGEALALWRGPAFPDLSDENAPPEIFGLEEERLRCLEASFQAELDEGGGPDLVPALDTLTVSYPLREVFHAQRIVALYRAGRQADALAAYQAVRSTLREELGVDPGPDLQRLELAVLRQDACLEPPEPTRTSTPVLPVVSNARTGRSGTLDAIASAAKREDAPLVSLIAPEGDAQGPIALEVAAVVPDRFAGHAVLVPLGVSGHGLVVSTLADALGLPPGVCPPVSAEMRHHLMAEAPLLVLDHLQHLIALYPGSGAR